MSSNPLMASGNILIAEAIDILSPNGHTEHSNAVRMLALHRDLLLSENAALKRKIALPEEIVQAMRDVLNGTYHSLPVHNPRKAAT